MLIVVVSDGLDFSEDDHHEEHRQKLSQRHEIHFAKVIVPEPRVPLRSVVVLQWSVPASRCRGAALLHLHCGDGRDDGELLYNRV